MKEGPFLQADYPLVEPVVLYLHPTQPEAAKRFCEFAVGPDGSAIAEKFGLVTPYMQKKAEGKARQAEAKAGKGTHLPGAGVAVGLVPTGLGDEFAFARSAVVVDCVPMVSDVPAVEAFSGGAGKELLFVMDRPGEEAMRVQGKRWGELNPAEFTLAGRAAAVVVHGSSKMDAITLAQLRAAFAGEAGEWKTFGAGGSGDGGRIACYGPRAPDLAAAVFGKEVLALDKCKMAAWKKDSAEVIAAVAADANGIGIVDATAIAGARGVKVLGIRMGGAPAAAGVGAVGAEKVLYPTPETIRNATYPLSQRLFLYVHPQASETAKDFAKFIATCGQSAESPYFDTVSQVAEVYRKNGLIPLGIEPAKLKFPTTAPWTEDAPVNKVLKAASRPAGTVTPSPAPVPSVGKGPAVAPTPAATPAPSPVDSEPPRVTPAPRSR
jgi:ABC-type phosphate transport system substrate-binding protein